MDRRRRVEILVVVFIPGMLTGGVFVQVTRLFLPRKGPGAE